MMIKVQNSSSKPLLAVGVVVVALLGAGAWWWSSGGDQPSVLDGGAAGSGESRGLWPSAGVGDDTSANPSATAPSLADARPDGVDADDWERLLTVMGRMGQSKEEARRLVGLVRYQRDFEKMQTLDQEQDARARRRMAQGLMAELPERLKTGEFTLMESAFMGAALIAEIETDDAFKNRFVSGEQLPGRQSQVPIIVNHQHRYISFGSEDPQLCFKYTLLDPDGKAAPLVLYQRFIFNLSWAPEKFKENEAIAEDLFDSGELELF